MGPMIDDDIMPVFVINGFLEAGKTSFLSFTMDQEYFRTEGKTLLIVCEEGDTEYDEKLLKDTKTAVVYMDDMSQMTPERLTELELLRLPLWPKTPPQSSRPRRRGPPSSGPGQSPRP